MAGLKDIIKGTVEGLTGPVADYLKARQELRSRERVRKAELEDAKHERTITSIREGRAADATWELESLKAHADGWKDEYLTILYSVPAWLCFIKIGSFDGSKVVTDGFNALSATPGWYQLAFVSISLAPFGIRVWRRLQYDTE